MAEPENMPENGVRAMWSEDELDTAPAPFGSDVDAKGRVLARTRAELPAGAPATPEPAPVVSRFRRPRTWWAASAAIVVALVAGLLVGQIGDGPVANAAAKELNQAADKIAADKIGDSDEPLRPGQYRYVATHAWWMSTADVGQDSLSYLEEHLIETWVPADERQEWMQRDAVTGNRKWIDGSEQEAKAEGVDLGGTGPAEQRRAPCGDFSAAEEGREPCTQEGGWQGPDEEVMASLPRDPYALYDRLREDTEGRGQDENLEMLVYAADMLRSGRVPADLRAALYRTLGLVPGLIVTDKVVNLDGREGVAFGISAAGTRQDVIIDPATGQFIGERQILDEGFDGVPTGTVASYSSVTTVVVNGIGDKPAG